MRKLLLISLVVLSGLAKSYHAAAQAANQQDSLALVDVLQSIYGDNWMSVLGINPNTLLSTWEMVGNYGMAILDQNGRIVKLTIAAQPQSMLGPISPSISNLTALEGLQIGPVQGQCALTGNIPSSIAGLAQLNSLEIINTNITGSIPSSIGNLAQLTWLEIINNNITGAIPSSIGNLSNLSTLLLYGNELTGSIPASLTNLTHINEMRLDGNQLSGIVPYFLGNVYNIYLENNKFTFDGLEDFLDLYNSNFPNPGLLDYFPQDTIIPIHQHGYTLAVSAGGTLSNNTYQWTEILDNTDNTSKTFTIKGDSTFTPEEPGLYKVSVTNSIATGLTLSSGSPIKITTVDPKFRFISGNVINTEINDDNGEIVTSPISCTITAYDAGTSTVEGSVTSSSDGTFKITGLSNDNYDLMATYTASDGTSYSVVENNVAVYSSGVQLEMPAGLIENISSYNDTLSNLQCYLDDLGSSVSVGAYNMTPSTEFITGEENITDNQDEAIEALERLCIAERLLDKYYEQAAALNNQFVSSVSNLGGFIYGMLLPGDGDDESGSWGANILNSAIDQLKNDALNALKSAIEIPIDNITSPYTTYYHDAIEMIFEQIEGGNSIGGLYDLTLKSTVDQTLTNQNLNNIYISNTADEVPNSVNNAENGTFSGNISNTILNRNVALGTSEASTSTALSYAQSYDQQPQWVQILTQVTGVAEYIPGVGQYAAILKTGLNAIHLSFIGASIYQCLYREGQLVGEANQNIPASFARKRPDQWNLFNARIQASQLASLDSLVQNFEGQYAINLDNINQNDTSNLYQNLTNLVQLNGQIGDSALNIINGIKAAIPNSGIAYNTYLTDLQNALFGSPFVRFAQLISLVKYARTFNDTLRDSLTYHFPDMRYSDSAMLAELGTMSGTLANVPTPAYISVSKSGIPLKMLLNTDTTVTVRFKNYGSTATSGVYAKIQIDTPFTASVDSVYIGNLNAEQQDSLTFTIQAPIADTFSHYTIHFFANSAITNPLGGTIFSRSPSQPFNLPSSNFKVSASGATCVGSNDGAIKIIADSSLPYTATVSNSSFDSSYSFNDSLAVNNLSAGTYQVCITVQGRQGYEQCYNLAITQPKPLSAYAVVNPSQHTITLNMDGGHIYYIQLGHQFYTTSNNEITLPLTSNEHLLMISTDKSCQGIVRKQINIPGEVMSYPNPFRDYLNIDFGKSNVANAIIKITDMSTGRMVYDERAENQSGTMQLNTSDFGGGIYALDIYFDNVKYTFKIVKVEK